MPLTKTVTLEPKAWKKDAVSNAIYPPPIITKESGKSWTVGWSLYISSLVMQYSLPSISGFTATVPVPIIIPFLALNSIFPFSVLAKTVVGSTISPIP